MIENRKKIQKIREICADPEFSTERMWIEIKRTIDPDSLDEQDYTVLGNDFRERRLYQDAVDAYWKAVSNSSPGLDCVELIILTLEQMTPKEDDLHHLATTLRIDINLSSEWSEKNQQLLKKLVERYNALKEKHGFKG